MDQPSIFFLINVGASSQNVRTTQLSLITNGARLEVSHQWKRCCKRHNIQVYGR